MSLCEGRSTSSGGLGCEVPASAGGGVTREEVMGEGVTGEGATGEGATRKGATGEGATRKGVAREVVAGYSRKVQHRQHLDQQLAHNNRQDYSAIVSK